MDKNRNKTQKVKKLKKRRLQRSISKNIREIRKRCNMAKTVRLADIGERLDVSAVTVSKALSGQKGVSEEMRQKIIKVADELGYLKRVREQERHGGYNIGVIVAERYLQESESFYWKLYQELSQRAIARDCFMILEIVSHKDERTEELPKILQEKKVDGVIIVGAFITAYSRFLAKNIQIPLLYLDTPGTLDSCDSVVSNNMMGGYHMTNYLFKKGHRQIGFVGTRLTTTSIDDRFLGYLRSLMEHGINPRQDWIIDDRDREYGQVDIKSKFQLPEEMPTAFFCNCDLSAYVLVRKLNEAGYNVPDDISVAGFDNYVNRMDNYISETLENIGLTTYEINMKEMAKRAMHIILHKLDNASYTTGMFVLPGKFIERGSVKKTGDEVPFI